MSGTWRILVGHGVNLDLLGRREPGIYGQSTLADIERTLRAQVSALVTLAGAGSCELVFFQTNDEAAYLNRISEGWDGLVLNPGAWTHTSLALADRLSALQVPYVEVHLSNLSSREDFRQHSYSAPKACGVVYGFGADSYSCALFGLLLRLSRNKRPESP